MNQRMTKWLLLTTFVFSWLINILSIPLITFIMGSTHDSFYYSENDQTHLVFSHSNNHEHNNSDEHENYFENEHSHQQALINDHHDSELLSNKLLSQDHVIHIHSLEKVIIKNSYELSSNYDRGPPLADEITCIFNYIPPDITNSYKKDKPPLRANTASLSLKTIVLTI